MATPSTIEISRLGPEDYYNIATGNRGEENPMLLYLWKFAREKADEWNARAARTVYNNLTGKGLKILVGYTMDGYRAYDAKYGPAPIVPFTANAAWHAFVGGHAWILTLADGPRIYRCTEVKQDKDGKAEWTITAGNRRQRITMRDEYLSRLGALPADVPGEVVTERMAGAEWVAEGEPYKITSKNFVRVQYGPECRSVIANAAEQAVKVYNYESLKDSGNYRILFCFEYGPRPTNIDKDQQIMGGDYLEMDDKAIVPGVVHGGSVEVMRHAEEVCASEGVKLGAALGLSREFADQQSLTSGKSKSFDLLDIKTFVALAAHQVSAAVNLAYLADAEMKGYPEEEASHIALPGDLKPADPDLDLRVISEACKFINVPAVWLAAQSEVAKLGLGRLIPAADLEKILGEIEKTKGAARPWVEGYGSDMSSVGGGVDLADDGEPDDDDAGMPGKPAPAEPTAGGAADTAAIQSVALNGAQVTAASQITKDYNAGDLSRSSALAMLTNFFGIDAATAADILGPGPERFEKSAEPPKKPLDTPPQAT